MFINRRKFNGMTMSSFFMGGFFSFLNLEKSNDTFQTLSIVSRRKALTNKTILSTIEDMPALEKLKMVKGFHMESGTLVSTKIIEFSSHRLIAHQWKSKKDYLDYLEKINFDQLSRELRGRGLSLHMIKG